MNENQPILHMPEYCVQGERIPFYILWNEEIRNKVTITLPSGIALAEIYNTSLDNLKIHNNVCSIHDTEINGYVGGVFNSIVYNQPSVTKKIIFQIHDNHDQIYERVVELFRPDVRFDDTVETINIHANKEGKPIVRGNIKIFNSGKGTAVVKLKITPDSEIKEGQPHGFEEFKAKFLVDLDEAFLELIKKFPQNSKLLERMRLIIMNPFSSKIKRADVRKSIRDLEYVFNNNENFVKDFARLVAIAYLKNVSIITNADSFFAFLKSTGKNKLLLLDAMKVLKIQPQTQILKIELQTTDLASNEYPLKKLRPIKIMSDASYYIPFYQIIDSSGEK